MKEAYPLCWPSGYKRTAHRSSSRFTQTWETAQKFLRLEIERLGGSDLIVSTNLRIRNDGFLYAYRTKAKILHPDAGGDAEKFNDLQKAYKEGMEQFKN